MSLAGDRESKPATQAVAGISPALTTTAVDAALRVVVLLGRIEVSSR